MSDPIDSNRMPAGQVVDLAGNRPDFRGVIGTGWRAWSMPRDWEAMALGVITVAGLALRLIAAHRLSPHVDEASSLLAAHAVAEHGVPILPSGTVYFQGATLSYLLQPMLWLGIDAPGDLLVLRLPLVVLGTATLWLCVQLGKEVSGKVQVGVVMAALVAIDPLSVQWSGHLRMYGLLQALTISLVWAYVRMLKRGPTGPGVATVAVLFWAAVFTHVGAALLAPAMLLAAMLVHGKTMVRRWALTGCLILCAVAPATLIVLNRVLVPSSAGPVGGVATGSTPGAVSFVGDSLLAPLARFQIPLNEWDWASVTRPHNLFWLVPGVIVATCTVAGSRLWSSRERLEDDGRNAMLSLLALYWLPVVAVGAFSVSPHARYLLNVHTIGYVFVAMVMVELGGRYFVRTIGVAGPFARLAGVVVMVGIVVAITAGLVWRLDHPVVQPDYNAAMQYVAERHRSGEPVVVALPAVAELAMEDTDLDDVYFLAGPADQPRAQRYTRLSNDGALVDYWIGVESVMDTGRLRSILLEHPGAWVVVDEQRLSTEWAFAGETERTLNDLTYPVIRTPGGALVLRVVPELATVEPKRPRSEPGIAMLEGDIVRGTT